MAILFAHFQSWFQQYGLVAVFVVLLVENFGVPLPGELALLYAGYQMRMAGGFGWPELVAAASAGSILGQAAGYGAGRWAGEWVRGRMGRLARFEPYFQRHGAVTILVSRFVAGLRVIAGPLAGLYGMAWRRFLLVNVVGALLWVSAVSGIGRLMGAHWNRLVQTMAHVDLLVLGLGLVAAAWAWHRLQKGL